MKQIKIQTQKNKIKAEEQEERLKELEKEKEKRRKKILKRIQDIFHKKDEYDKKKNEIFFRNKSLKKEHFGKLIKNKSLITQIEDSKRESILFDELERLNRGINKDLSVESKRIKAQLSSITNQIEYEEEIKDFKKKIYIIKDESILTKNKKEKIDLYKEKLRLDEEKKRKEAESNLEKVSS